MHATEETFPAPEHDHARCMDEALVAAERLCAERGSKLTPVRRRVLEIVWQRHAPVGAYDILSELQRDAEHDGQRSARVAPPTVYRALDFLIEHGLVHKVESQNAFIGCSHPEGGHDCGFLICRNCGTTLEIHDRRLFADLDAIARRHGFRVTGSTVEIAGLCPSCQSGDA